MSNASGPKPEGRSATGPPASIASLPDVGENLEDRAPTRYDELADFLRHVGKDPSALIFEDELTGIHNRRFLLSHLEHKIRWTSGEDFPLALLFMDVDGFKDINDTHGHDTGDQALIWVADLLRTVAGSDGLPVRYGGDEFMLVLPGMDRTAARTVTDRILQHVKDRPFQHRGTGRVIPITLSVGISAAPDDARDRSELINAADAALYFAKKSGRNQAAAASEIDPEEVFSHTALLRLKSSGISGRSQELNLVDQALRSMEQGRSQAVVFQGAPGVGKTTLLDTVRKNLQSERSFWVTKVAGDAREGGRPYYMVTKILLSLLNEREDGGASLLADLTTEQRSHLAHVLPGLVEEELPTELDRDTRQSIFKCITSFLCAAVDSGPFVLLIDDFQFVDEATLALLSVAVERGELTFALCATVGESLGGGGVDSDSSPAASFIATPPEGIQVRTSTLSPLQAEDIAEYLRGIFPNLEMPEGFEKDLAQVTSGNPFFLAEIVRVLLDTGKVRLVGQAWVVEPVDMAFLASSLEEIVTQKIAALDQKDREILARASALGEDIPLSVLTGSSDLDEASVQAFLDRAENMGLISLDFQVNDEVMHFLGKRILDISYAAIDEDRRAELHEELGQYQERLYEQRLLPSASMLAYHFRRSANAAKTTQYDQVTRAYAESVFESSEVAGYGADQEIEFGTPLQTEDLALIPGVLRSMLLAVRNIQLYPAESAAIANAVEGALATLDQILVRSERLTFTHAEGVLSANGEELELAEIKLMVGSVIELFVGAEVKALSFTPGVSPEELGVFFKTLGEAGSGTLEKNFWTRTAAQHGFSHVELRQMRYSRLPAAPGADSGSGVPVSTEDELTPDELALIPNLLRDLLKAAADVRLYSLTNERVVGSIRELVDSIREVVGAHPAVTVSRIEALLLINGARVDATQWQAIGSAFIEFMDGLDLNSITFMEEISPTDLETFLGALGEASIGEREKGFWEVFAADRQLGGIAFNQEDYSLGLIQAAVLGQAARDEVQRQGQAQTGAQDQATPEADESEAVELPKEQQQTVALAKDFLLEGKHEEALQLLRSIFADFPEKPGAERVTAVDTCGEIFHKVVLGLQHDFTKLVFTALPDVFEQESDPVVLEKLTTLFYEMAASSIQFSDYRLAARIYNVVDLRRQALRESGQEGSSAYSALTSITLDDRTRQLLTDDLRSGQTDRQSRASLAVGHVGLPAVPMLIAVVKQERDLRMRQIAAGLLAGLGSEAGEELKETLLTEVLLEHRYRVLEVIDMVTTELRTELVFSMADENPKIRRAAFQLFERLRQDSLIDVVLPLAKGSDEGVAKGAVRSLAYLETPRAADALIEILKETTKPELASACSKALGRLKADGAVEALDTLLSQKRWGFLGYHWGEEVRASAAVALRQIGGPRASTALAKHKDDKSARIRAVTSATVGDLPVAEKDE